MERQFKPKALEDVLCFLNGKSIKPNNIGIYPVYGSNGIIGNSEQSIFENSIIIGRVGAYCGSIAYCPSKFWASDNTIVALPKQSEDSVKFFAYLLRHLRLNSYAGGSAQPLITQTVLKKIEVFIPCSQLQQKIASILSAYDDLIENNTRRIQILEEMARRIYEEWFVHFRFPNHENIKLVESKLGLIPEGWEVKKLGDTCDILMGQAPPSTFYNEDGEGLPFHQGVTNFGDRFPTDKKFCKITNRQAKSGDILFSVRAPVGRLNIATKDIIIGRGLSSIRDKKGNQCFLFQQLKHVFQEEDIIGNGSIFKSVTKIEMHNILLLKPSNETVRKFEAIVMLIFRNLRLLTDKNSNLRKTRDLLLPKLISGEIDVSEFPDP